MITVNHSYHVFFCVRPGISAVVLRLPRSDVAEKSMGVDRKLGIHTYIHTYIYI